MKTRIAALIAALSSLTMPAQAQAFTWYVAAKGGPFGDGCESLATFYSQLESKFVVQGMNLPQYAQKAWEVPDDVVNTMSAVGANVSIAKRGDGWVILNWDGGGLPILLGYDRCEQFLAAK